MTTLAIQSSGVCMDLYRPCAESVKAQDIITCLKNINRYAGSTRLSVAAHSAFCATLTKYTPQDVSSKDRLYHLMILHDAHEAYTGDVINPCMAALKEIQAMLFGLQNVNIHFCLDVLKTGIDKAIFEAAGVAPPSVLERGLMKKIDNDALDIEMKLFGAGNMPEHLSVYGDWLVNRLKSPEYRADLEAEFEAAINTMIWAKNE